MNLLDLFVEIGVEDNASENVESIGNKIKSGLGTAAKVGAAAIGAVASATAAVSTAFVKGVTDVGSYANEIDKMSQKMNMTAESYQEWDFILEHAGTSISAMQGSMKTLASAAQSGNEAFETLGISIEDAASMSSEDLFAATISALQNVESDTERTYLSAQLLGRGATELGALLNMSAEEVENMRSSVHDLGGVLSDDAVKAGANFSDSLQNLKTSFSGLKNGMLSDFLPAATAVMDGLTAIFSGDYDEGISMISSGVDELVDHLSEAAPMFLELGGEILQSLVTAITNNLPTLLESGLAVVEMLLTGIVQNLPAIVAAISALIPQIVTTIVTMLPQLVQAGLQIILTLANSLSTSLPQLIPTIVDVISEIVLTLTDPDNLSTLIDAAIAIIMALADGLIAALPSLIAAAPEIISNLITALVDNAPKIVSAAVELIKTLASGLLDNLDDIGSAAGDIVSSIVDGIGALLDSVSTAAGNIASAIYDAISSAVSSAYSWGVDLIKNFVNGIKAKAKEVKDSIVGVATDISLLLHFSEPDEGPLKDFHTFAPDMLDLFAQGVKDNKKMLTDTIADAFDFRSTIYDGMDYSASYSGGGNGSAGIVSIEKVDININGGEYGSVKELADAVADRLQTMVDRRSAAWMAI